MNSDYYMIHQENVLCKFPNNFSIIVMKKKKTVKIVIFITARYLNDRKYKEFLSELNLQYSVIIMYNIEVSIKQRLSFGKLNCLFTNKKLNFQK